MKKLDGIKPKGLVIGVLGRDGAGKSTFVREFGKAMQAYFPKVEKYHTFAGFVYRRGMFPKKNSNWNLSTPHNEKLRNSFTSFLKINLFFMEAVLGYWFKVFPLKKKSGLIIFDRSFIDVLADPVRYRINLNRRYVRALHYLIPKPDIWIILDLPSDTLIKRKKDLTYEMAEHLRYEYLQLQKFLSNSIVINNENELNDTIVQASNFVLDYLKKKMIQVNIG